MSDHWIMADNYSLCGLLGLPLEFYIHFWDHGQQQENKTDQGKMVSGYKGLTYVERFMAYFYKD